MQPPAPTVASTGPYSGWKGLFRPVDNPAEAARVEVVVLERDGQPLLIVPRGAPEAALALQLYPAQTRKARLARWLWRSMLRRTITFGLERDCLALDLRDPLIGFLKQLAGGPELPLFAMLAGNPRVRGRRFLVLVFDSNGQPVAVVKVGAEPLAAELIEKEISFLTSVAPSTAGVPKLRHRFAQGKWRAFASDFVHGDSPRKGQLDSLPPLLTSWLSKGPRLPLSEFPAWQRLTHACANDALFVPITNELAGLSIQPSIFHGDFAPWNVKVSPTDGSWTVLDWERGETTGPPAWDWFHFVIQAAILAGKQSGAKLVRTAQSLLTSERFRVYAQRAGLAGRENAWLLAYLLHCREVLGQNRTLPEIPELLHLVARQ